MDLQWTVTANKVVQAFDDGDKKRFKNLKNVEKLQSYPIGSTTAGNYIIRNISTLVLMASIMNNHVKYYTHIFMISYLFYVLACHKIEESLKQRISHPVK